MYFSHELGILPFMFSPFKNIKKIKKLLKYHSSELVVIPSSVYLYSSKAVFKIFLRHDKSFIDWSKVIFSLELTYINGP